MRSGSISIDERILHLHRRSPPPSPSTSSSSIPISSTNLCREEQSRGKVRSFACSSISIFGDDELCSSISSDELTPLKTTSPPSNTALLLSSDEDEDEDEVVELTPSKTEFELTPAPP
ncbi:hypothetical protein Dimus_016503 [Dionaea muscipula]